MQSTTAHKQFTVCGMMVHYTTQCLHKCVKSQLQMMSDFMRLASQIMLMLQHTSDNFCMIQSKLQSRGGQECLYAVQVMSQVTESYKGGSLGA